MEHDFEKIIREKVDQAEGARMEFNRERVWAGLAVAQPAQSKKGWYYYAAAAAVLLLIGFTFFSQTDEPEKQFAQRKTVKLPFDKLRVRNKEEEKVSIPVIAPIQQKEGKHLGDKSKSKKTLVKEVVPEVPAEEKISLSEPVQLAEVNKPIEPVKSAKPKAVRRKIEPIVGFVPNDNFTAEVPKPRATIRVRLAYENNKETYANSGEPKSFKTRIN